MFSGTKAVPHSLSSISSGKNSCARDALNNREDTVGVDRKTCGSNDSTPHVPLRVDEARTPIASRTRIEPFDSRLRLHIGRTKVCASLNLSHMLLCSLVDCALSFLYMLRPFVYKPVNLLINYQYARYSSSTPSKRESGKSAR